MKLLLVHADLLEYEVTKEIEGVAEEVEDADKQGRMEDGLVAFIAVETGDEADPDEVVARAAEEIADVAGKVGAERVCLYPYAHLSSDLGSPRVAKAILRDLEAALAGDFDVLRSPFGYYKAFRLDCKGHPLSELSRDIVVGERAGETDGGAATRARGDGEAAPRPKRPSKARAEAAEAAEAAESKAVQAEKHLKSTWYVLTTGGDLVPADEFDFDGHPDLGTLYAYESDKERAGGREPAHVQTMQDQELVDYEPGSDPGNLRWYPKGQLIKRLLEDHVSRIVQDYGGMRVETPIMYDLDHPALSKYLDRFPARQYIVASEDKDLFLRFAACFGQYLIGHDMTMSWRNLPLRLYELTHYSFRREQRGELTGLKRLRAFTMPDMHTVCADMDQATDEFLAQFDLSRRWMEDLGVPYATAVRFVRDFYDDHEDFARAIVDRLGEPVLVEMWDERFFYFVTKFEFNVVDTQGKASALSTVQIDVENTERFDIGYADKEGKRRHGPLLHASISGSVDRNLYAILEHQARRAERGKKPEWPFWLAPTQVRFVPVNDGFIDVCLEMAETLTDDDIRADVDDRDEGIGKRIRAAEKEWVPMVVVYGEKEEAADVLPVRLRTGETAERSLEDLRAECAERLEGLPSATLPLPTRLSERPKFRG